MGCAGCCGGGLLSALRQRLGRDDALSAGGQVILQGVPLRECSPLFSYPPVFGFLMSPFAAMPLGLRVAIWYVISVAATVGCFLISEKLVFRLLPGRWSETELAALRVVTFILSIKFVLAVFEWQDTTRWPVSSCLPAFGPSSSTTAIGWAPLRWRWRRRSRRHRWFSFRTLWSSAVSWRREFSLSFSSDCGCCPTPMRRSKTCSRITWKRGCCRSPVRRWPTKPRIRRAILGELGGR
jgi:glycosyl transferase family 87